jgi:hypothetical protein
MHIPRPTTIRPATLALLLLAISPAHSQVVETRYGPVEFIGLRSWKAERLIDSLEVLDSLRQPGSRDLPSHSPYFWLSDLEHRFGFPVVEVVPYSDSTAGRNQVYWVVTVVEPADSSKLRRITRPLTWNPGPSDPELEGLDTMYSRNPGSWWIAVRSFGYIAAGKVEEGRAAVRAELEVLNRFRIRSHSEPIPTEREIEQLWLRIAAITKPYQKKYALQALATDTNVDHRVVAAAVLANFSHDDRVWNALMAAQFDPWEDVASQALTTLIGLATHLPRPIDWTASTEVIADILDGSNLEALPEILDVLDTTAISPVLAPFILPGHEELLLGYLAAHHERERTAAHRFLVRMAGRDLGSDPAVWRKWIAGLARAADR